MAYNCSSCGTGYCRNNHNSCSSRRCGALRHIGCDSCSRCASATATTCAGYPLYYEGPCPCAQNSCNGYCAGNCNSCNNNCNNGCHNNCHCGCGETQTPWNNGSSCGCNGSCNGNCGCNCCGNKNLCAAEFTSYAPQSCCAGGSFSFRRNRCHGGGFSECAGGVRVENSGMYMLTYTFSAPQGMNAASHLCLACGGSPINASGSYIAPVTCANSRTAMGQALVELNAGDVISLTSSTAMDICECGCNSPVATLILQRIG